MPYRLAYHPDVRSEDIPAISRNLKDRIARAIETRLTTEPQRYGEPLRRTLKGYWKLRVGDYRVVFKVVENEVWIYGIGGIQQHVSRQRCRRSRLSLVDIVRSGPKDVAERGEGLLGKAFELLPRRDPNH